MHRNEERIPEEEQNGGGGDDDDDENSASACGCACMARAKSAFPDKKFSLTSSMKNETKRPLSLSDARACFLLCTAGR